MAQSRFFSSTAQPTTLTSSVSNATTTIPVAATTGFPANTPFTIALDYGGSLEELCDVTAVAGLNFTVVRAVDGTSAASHAVGVAVRHVSSARDFNEDNAHVNSASGVHGVTGAVVGTTDTQTLTNKTLTAPAFSGFSPSLSLGSTNAVGTSPLTVKAVAAQTAKSINVQDSTGATVFSVSPTGDIATTGVGQVIYLTSGGSTRANTTTLAPDPNLFTTLQAGTYDISGVLAGGGASPNSGNLSVVYAGSATLAINSFIWFIGSSGTTNTQVNAALSQTPKDFSSTSVIGSASTPTFTGGFLTITAPGTFGVNWAQTTSSATPTTLYGYLRITRIA